MLLPGTVHHMPEGSGPTPTPFVQLNDVLDRLVLGVQDALGPNFAGAYLVGSFAVGDADVHSDCDFLVATREPINVAQEVAIRRLHRSLPARDGHWNRHLEGSYPPIEDLRTLDALGRDWLFVDHGHAEMEWSTHCNSLEHRWALRHHGVVLTGPDAEEFADVPAELLREKMRQQIPHLMTDLATWTRVEDIAWAQRYAVTTLCRMLFTLCHGRLASKREALMWASEELGERWCPLIQRAEAERTRGWDTSDRPDRESLRMTYEFAEHVTYVVSKGRLSG